MRPTRSLRVGIDVGGTFTDLVAVESWSGRFVTRKIPSTPREPHRAAMLALESLLAAYPQRPQIELLAHATTIATNALLGQVGLELPRVALVTTRGFRDVIEIGRQNRSEVYNLFVGRRRPLVAREDRFTVDERVDYEGNVLEPLDEQSVRAACSALAALPGVAAVAVCLLNSYANDAHERRVADALAAALPAAHIVRSSQIDPEYREYERFSTTVVNAALAPIVEAYLERLIGELRDSGIAAPLYVMRSDGGMAAARHIAARPAAIVESGPASGAVATAALGRRIGTARLLSFDMGGTTAKAATILDGAALVVHEFEAAGATHSGRAVKGSGYPVRFPFLDLAEVSAGGGTIACVDEGGSLRAGPLSAGADPGPACYGTSERPTVTDANVVLGRLHQRHLLGGAFPIDAARARAAIESLARRLHVSPETTAEGVVAIVDDAMARVLRIVTVERGIDPRGFTLVAFGGGGPLHACAVAESLEVRRVLVPPHPGLFSARGLLDAELRVNDVRALFGEAGDVDRAAVDEFFGGSELRARDELLAQGADPGTIVFRREYDARYRGQSFELSVGADGPVESVAARFHATHRSRYGYDAPDEVVELVNARMTASGRVAPHTEPEADALEADVPELRAAWIDGAFADVPVFARAAVAEERRIDGPAIVEEYDATTYLAPGWTLTVEDALLVLNWAGR